MVFKASLANTSSLAIPLIKNLRHPFRPLELSIIENLV